MLVLVAGPSGAGKDTLLAAAKPVIASDTGGEGHKRGALADGLARFVAALNRAAWITNGPPG